MNVLFTFFFNIILTQLGDYCLNFVFIAEGILESRYL